MLYALVAIPCAAALLTCCASSRDGASAGRLGLFLALVELVVGIPLVTSMRDLPPVHLAWFHLWGTGAVVSLGLASDGLSSWLIQLVTLLTPIAILASRDQVGERMREFVVGILALEGLMILALLATDLVLFYLAFEAMLIPMMILIAAYGGRDRRGAALQFFIYTMAGSVFMLVGIWYLAARIGSTDLHTVITAMPFLPARAQLPLFVAFCLAFAVKVPLVPFHGWQARTYAECPAGGAIILAGAMAKIGIYGFLRFVLPMFPGLCVQYAHVFIALGLIGVVAGALMTLAQKEIKRVLAYSSLSHLGLVVVGIFTFSPAALSGAVVQMLAHGLSIAALFLIVGYVEHRGGLQGADGRSVDHCGGLSGPAPVLAVLFLIAALASAALPGTGDFAGEFMLLLGAFTSAWWIGVIAALTTILAAVYLLWLVQRWLYGTLRPEWRGVRDLHAHEGLAVVPLLLLSLALGFYPRVVTDQAAPVVEGLGAPAAHIASAPATPVRSEEPHAKR